MMSHHHRQPTGRRSMVPPVSYRHSHMDPPTPICWPSCAAMHLGQTLGATWADAGTDRHDQARSAAVQRRVMTSAPCRQGEAGLSRPSRLLLSPSAITSAVPLRFAGLISWAGQPSPVPLICGLAPSRGVTEERLRNTYGARRAGKPFGCEVVQITLQATRPFTTLLTRAKPDAGSRLRPPSHQHRLPRCRRHRSRRGCRVAEGRPWRHGTRLTHAIVRT